MSGLVIGIIIVVIIIVVGIIAASRSSSGGGGSGPTGCRSDTDCGGATTACDKASGKCFACTANNAADAHCPADFPFCVANQCKKCTDSLGCPSDPAHPERTKCLQGNSCVVCRNGGDCSSPTPRCLDDNSACVECFQGGPVARAFDNSSLAGRALMIANAGMETFQGAKKPRREGCAAAPVGTPSFNDMSLAERALTISAAGLGRPSTQTLLAAGSSPMHSCG